MTAPIAFLSHASEDKPIVRIFAQELTRNGIKVFLDEWEIAPGDSIRQRIDHGLGECTHFLAVVSSASLSKSWVNQELDAGLVRKLAGNAKFIPLRIKLLPSELPPLLQGMLSPEITDPILDARKLAAVIFQVSQRPPLGQPPRAIRHSNPKIGISPAAQAIARVMVEQSNYGKPRDPKLTPEKLSQMSGLSEDDMIAGIDQLQKMGAIQTEQPMGYEQFAVAFPTGRFFLLFDPIFGDNDPEADARLVATQLVNTQSSSGSAHDLAAKFEWEARRLNPALEYLAMKNLIKSSKELDRTFSHAYFMTTVAIKNFVH